MNRFIRIIPYILPIGFLVFFLYLTGSRIKIEKLPDPMPRVLSLFTQIPAGFVPVVDVIDGDTIVIFQDGKEETVRLLGVDTPETKDPRKPVQCFGYKASAYTKGMLAGKAVHLLADPMETDRDKYNRLLRYVYLEDGTLINEQLVAQGYAFAYERFPTARLEQLKALEKDARDHKRGLWGACEVTIKNGGKTKSTQAEKE